MRGVVKMRTQILLLSLSCYSASIYAKNLTEENEPIVIASYELAGEELWDEYFSLDNIVLLEPIVDDPDHATYINHPPYTAEENVVHRLVCDRGDDEGRAKIVSGAPPYIIGPSGPGPCRQGFSHVHFSGENNGIKTHKRSQNVPIHPHLSDYDLALQFAHRTCGEYGFDAIPVFNGPTAFIEFNEGASNAHYFDYNLTQGLSFDCVLP